MDDVSGKLSAAVPTYPRHRGRARPIISAAHVGVGAGWGAVAFMSAYGVLHALRITGCQLVLLSRISPIPLFAVFVASSAFGLVAFAIFTACADTPHARLVELPRVLALTSVVFTLEMLCFP